jgi:hypothetical protein
MSNTAAGEYTNRPEVDLPTYREVVDTIEEREGAVTG